MDEIIIKYLLREATAEEKKSLEKWIEESEANYNYFLFYKNIYNIANTPFPVSAIEEEKALQNVLSKTSSNRNRTVVMRIAAALVGVTFLSVIAVKLLTSEDTFEQRKQNSANTNELQKGKTAILTLTSGRKVILNKDAAEKITDENGVIIDMRDGEIKYNTSDLRASKEQFNELYVPRSCEFYVELDDGTKVWINADTKLKYPTKFTDSERKVFLEGEAFFEVTPDQKRPFRVISPSQDVTVLGTSFNVCSYTKNREMFITLERGKVEVNAKLSGQKTTLIQGEQAIIQKASGTISTRNVDAALYSEWRFGKLVFASCTLEEIFDRLSKYYDMDVSWENEAMKQIKFSGEIKKYEELSKVLDMIQTTDDVRFKIEKGKVIVRK